MERKELLQVVFFEAKNKKQPVREFIYEKELAVAATRLKEFEEIQ